MMNPELRDTIWSALNETRNESSIPILICYKDIGKDELDQPNEMFQDSGGSNQDTEEFLSSQRGFTLISVAFFKNPINIWIPSSLSKLNQTGISCKLISSSDTAGYYAKECGILQEDEEEINAKEFYEKAQNNRMWLESHLNTTKVLTRASKIHKYYLIDSLVNQNDEIMLVSNKPCDRAALTRAHLGIAKMEVHNSCIARSANILLSSRGFLDINQLLFNYPAYIDDSTKESYIFTMSNLASILGICFGFAVLKGDSFIEPANILILLIVELLATELIFACTSKNEDIE